MENSLWTSLGTNRKTDCASKEMQPYADKNTGTSQKECRFEKSAAVEVLKGLYCSTAFTWPSSDSVHSTFSATLSSVSLAYPCY